MSTFMSLLRKIPELLPRQTLFVVGGAVRDRLLDRPITDVDLMIDRNPTQWAGILAEKMGGTAFPLDVERGITRVSVAGTWHIDLARQQGPGVPGDLGRRDFTVNAMAVPLTEWVKPQWRKHVVDLHGGLRDLRRKLIRAVSKNTFPDDPLRLLRAFRIGAEMGFSIETLTLNMVKRHRLKLKTSAPERIHDEILKLLSTGNSHECFVKMDEAGLLDVFFPEARRLRKVAPQYYGDGGVLKHTLDGLKYLEAIIQNTAKWFPKHTKKIKSYLMESTGAYPRSAYLKWGILLHDIGKSSTGRVIDGRLRFFNHEHVGAKMIANLGQRYRWSKAEQENFVRLAQHHMRPGNLASHPQVSDKAMHRFFRDLGQDAIGMLIVSLADHLTYLTPREIQRHDTPHEVVTRKMIDRYYSHRERILPPKILNGHDIMNAFKLDPSPLIGQLLTELTEAQAEGTVTNQKEALEFVSRKLEISLINEEKK